MRISAFKRWQIDPAVSLSPLRVCLEHPNKHRKFSNFAFVKDNDFSFLNIKLNCTLHNIPVPMLVHVFFIRRFLFVNKNQQKTYSLYTKVREQDIRPWRVKKERTEKRRWK